jgi:hypothetical protein
MAKVFLVPPTDISNKDKNSSPELMNPGYLESLQNYHLPKDPSNNLLKSPPKM